MILLSAWILYVKYGHTTANLMSLTREQKIVDGKDTGAVVLTKEVRGYKVLSCGDRDMKVLRNIICPVKVPIGATLVRPSSDFLWISHKVRTDMYELDCQDLMKTFETCHGPIRDRYQYPADLIRHTEPGLDIDVTKGCVRGLHLFLERKHAEQFAF